MAGLGQLERSVMDALWESDAPLTAYDVQARIGGVKQLAATTVLTVLGRLEKKGFVVPDRSSRPHRYRPTASRADHVAELMHEVLGDAADRRAVLERFVGGVSPEDAAVLRRILGDS